MKILFLTSHLNTGGITTYLLSLTRGLVQKGHHVFIASAGGNCEGILKEYGGHHINLGFRTKSEVDVRIYLKLRILKKLILQEDINIIHAQTRVTQVMGYFLSRMTGRSLITTCHGFFKPRFFRRIFSCWGNSVIAVSRPVRKHLINDFKVEVDRVVTIPNGINIDNFVVVNESLKEQKRLKWNIKAKYVIGIIARLSDVKGIDILLQSMPLIVKEYPDILLMIVGEGPERQTLGALVEKLHLNANVRFENIVNQTADILPVFDVFVMSSRQEGLGLSVMEAQACALPVVASRVGGLIDLIEDGKTGCLVPVNDSQILAQKIIEIIKNSKEAKQMGLLARENIIRNFSLDQMVSSTEEIYEKHSSC